jgi:hypothetical protein
MPHPAKAAAITRRGLLSTDIRSGDMNQQNIRALTNHATLLNENGSELHAWSRQRLTTAFHAVDNLKKACGSVFARYTEISKKAIK